MPVFAPILSWLSPSKVKKASNRLPQTPQSLPGWTTLPEPPSTASPPSILNFDRSKRKFDEIEKPEVPVIPVKKRAVERTAAPSSSRLTLDMLSGKSASSNFRTVNVHIQPPTPPASAVQHTYADSCRSHVADSPCAHRGSKHKPKSARKKLVKFREPNTTNDSDITIEQFETPAVPSTRSLGKRKQDLPEEPIGSPSNPIVLDGHEEGAIGKKRKRVEVGTDVVEMSLSTANKKPRQDSQSTNKTAPPQSIRPEQSVSSETSSKKSKHDRNKKRRNDKQKQVERSDAMSRVGSSFPEVPKQIPARVQEIVTPTVNPPPAARPEQEDSAETSPVERKRKSKKGKEKQTVIQFDVAHCLPSTGLMDNRPPVSESAIESEVDEDMRWIHEIGLELGLTKDNIDVLEEIVQEPDDRKILFLIALHMARDPWEVPAETKTQLNEITRDLLIDFRWPGLFKDRQFNLYRFFEHVKGKPSKIGLDKSWVTDIAKLHALRKQLLLSFSEGRRQIIEAIIESINKNLPITQLARSLNKGTTTADLEMLAMMRETFMEGGRDGFFDRVDERLREFLQSTLRVVKKDLRRYLKRDREAFPESSEAARRR